MHPLKAPTQDQALAGTCSEELLVESELGPGYTLVYKSRYFFSSETEHSLRILLNTGSRKHLS